ncbi:cinnamoyl-CoA reductase 2-like [Papaver somniferum]|nr:cinnamoyl-CoA reductase 2-like [Papaver somniferum]
MKSLTQRQKGKAAEEMEKQRVCVTGAGGFLASWVIKFLLSKGYTVHGTVRDPSDEKHAHLNNLENAADNLQLFKADLLDYNSLCAAIAGCSGVLHVASPCTTPVADPMVELIEPAVKGTLNVLKACTEAKVKRVVAVSSRAAAIWNPSWPIDQPIDESCWSDKEYLNTIKNWYALSKTDAESEAWEYAKKTGLDVVTILPSLIIGPMLQSTMNASTLTLVKIIKDEAEEMVNNDLRIVDVRDVVAAILMAYEKPEAKGRYICSAHNATTQDLVDKLKTMYPMSHNPKKITKGEDKHKLSSEKLQKLGWTYIPLEKSLADSVKCYKEKGILL